MSDTGQGSPLASTIGRNIRAARQARGLNQRELAREVSDTTSNQQVSDWERGATRPSDTSLLRLAAILGHPYAWFVVDHANEKAAA